MNSIDHAKVSELQAVSARAYELARNAYDLAKTKADLDAAAIKQEAAARAYRDAITAREAALGIRPIIDPLLTRADQDVSIAAHQSNACAGSPGPSPMFRRCLLSNGTQ